MHPSPLAFSHLKRLVSIERVLTARGMIASLKPRGQRLIGPCPVHHGDHPQAFVVDRSKELWYCFTRCRGGSDVVELVRRMDHCQYPEVARYLAALAQVSPTPARVEASSPLHQDLAVVECPWGIMCLDQNGILAVALLGTHLSRSQLQLLRRTSRIVLMLDGDQTGRAASRQIADTLN